jgi:hypothetical protein
MLLAFVALDVIEYLKHLKLFERQQCWRLMAVG